MLNINRHQAITATGFKDKLPGPLKKHGAPVKTGELVHVRALGKGLLHLLLPALLLTDILDKAHEDVLIISPLIQGNRYLGHPAVRSVRPLFPELSL